MCPNLNGLWCSQITIQELLRVLALITPHILILLLCKKKFCFDHWCIYNHFQAKADSAAPLMPCLYIVCKWASVFYITSRYVTDTGPCYLRMSFNSPVILGSVFNLFSHQLHLEDHLRLYFADVLQAQGEGLSQEGLHVDFIPLDPNTHFLIKPPHHVHWTIIHRVCLCSAGSWIYFRGVS